VHGAYPQLPRAYPALFAFVADHGWTPSVPLREVYLVDPAATEGPQELKAEIQLPWPVGG